jgi:hypothetical protein
VAKLVVVPNYSIKPIYLGANHEKTQENPNYRFLFEIGNVQERDRERQCDDESGE